MDKNTALWIEFVSLTANFIAAVYVQVIRTVSICADDRIIVGDILLCCLDFNWHSKSLLVLMAHFLLEMSLDFNGKQLSSENEDN